MHIIEHSKQPRILILVAKLMMKILNSKIGDIARISKHKNTFAKDYAPNWSQEDFVIKKFKINVPWTYVTSDLKGEEFEFVGTFYQTNGKK